MNGGSSTDKTASGRALDIGPDQLGDFLEDLAKLVRTGQWGTIQPLDTPSAESQETSASGVPRGWSVEPCDEEECGIVGWSWGPVVNGEHHTMGFVEDGTDAGRAKAVGECIAYRAQLLAAADERCPRCASSDVAHYGANTACCRTCKHSFHSSASSEVVRLRARLKDRAKQCLDLSAEVASLRERLGSAPVLPNPDTTIPCANCIDTGWEPSVDGRVPCFYRCQASEVRAWTGGETMTHQRYRVWDKLNGDESEEGEHEIILARDPGNAAVRYAEQDHDGWTDGLYRAPQPICVRDGDLVREFGVVGEMRPRFAAVEVTSEEAGE